MDVFVANEQDLPIPEARLSGLARHALDLEEVDDDAELSVLFVTGDHIRRLNERFAGDDYVTDVLSFPMLEDDDDSLLLGDVVICPEMAQTNARRYGHTLDRELETLLVHGILHLLGYDHDEDDDKTRMERRQADILKSFESVVAP